MKNEKTNHISRSVIYTFGVILFIILILFSPQVKDSFLASAEMCVKNIIPPLFPALVLCSFMTGTGFPEKLKKILSFPVSLFHLSENCVEILFFGFTAGYPAGVKTAVQLVKANRLDKKEAAAAALISLNPGLLYTLVTVGRQQYGSIVFGAVLYASVLIGCIAIGILFRKANYFTTQRQSVKEPNIPYGNLLSDAVSNSTASCLSMTAWICLFGILSGFVKLIPLQFIQKFASTTLEISSAVQYAIKVDNVKLCAFSLAFGGFCVIFQLLPDLLFLELSPLRFIAARAVCGSFSYAAVKLMTLLLPASVPAAAVNSFSTVSCENGFSGMLSLIFLCIIFMNAIANRFKLC